MKTNDIASLLYSIKENIKVIESGEYNYILLDEIQSDFLDLMELIKLFLISERDSYYGYFMMNMQFQVNFSCNSIAGIKLNAFPPVFESNPLLLCKFQLKEIIYIFCHEIEHIILNHPAEMVKSNPTKDKQVFYEFNLAADASVNDRLNHEIVKEKRAFLSSPKGIITSDVVGQMFKINNIKNLENYAYYFDLIKKRQRYNQQNDGNENGQESVMDEMMKSENSNGQGNQEEKQTEATSEKEQSEMQQETGQMTSQTDEEISEEEAENPVTDKIVTAKNWNGHMEDHNWETGDDPEDAAAVVREFVNTAVDMMNEEKRGLMPGYFMSQVELINKPPVLSWQSILKKYIGTIAANKRKTRMKLNRRQPERFDLPGRVDDKVLKIVVVIDTSGSMDDSMISEVINEIFAILAKRRHDITIIECDTDVRKVYRARTPADIQKKVTGRGGTYFTPAIEYVNNDSYYRDALMIFFTDGFAEREIPRPRTYRNIWVILGEAKQLSVKEPFGAVLTM